MNFSKIKNILQEASLPGWKAQRELAPLYRKEYTLKEIQEKKPQYASVLITIYKKYEKFYFPLILRSVYEGIHSGQVGLPGGKKEKFDQTDEETAIRETYEEIGLSKESLHVIKKLSPLYLSPSNFYVKPFIALYENEKYLQFNADQNEVQKIFEIDLHKFLFGTKIVKKQISSQFEKVPVFQYDNITIWGATAMILNEFKYLFK